MSKIKSFVCAMLLSVASINYSGATHVEQDFYGKHKALKPVGAMSVLDYCDQHITNHIISYVKKKIWDQLHVYQRNITE